MLRSVLRVASTMARPTATRRVVARVFAAGAITTAGAAATTTISGGSSVAASNTRSRGVAHVSSSSTAASSSPVAAAAVAKKHWSSDEDGITAQQRSLAKVQSTNPAERLAAATTRDLLQSACTAPGVIEATLVREAVAASVPVSATAVAEEAAFLAKMEAEYGRDVLQVLRRQQWAVNIAATAHAKDHVATLVCYFQEGTQRILYRRISHA